MKRKLTYWMVVATTLLGHHFAGAQEGHLARIEISNQGAKNIIETGMKSAQAKLESFIKDYEIEDLDIGPEPADCTPEKMQKMWFWQAWKNCPGIPEILMPGSLWRNSHLPHPVQLNYRSPRVKKIEFGELTVRCKNHVCYVDVPIKQFAITGNLELVSLKNPGSVILQADGIDFRVQSDPAKEESIPHLKLKVHFGTDGDIKKVIQITPEDIGTSLGSVDAFVTFESEPSGIELLPTGYFSAEKADKYRDQHEERFSTYNQFHNFVTLASTINRNMLKEPLIRQKIANKVMQRLVPAIIKKLKIETEQSPIARTFTVNMPDLSMQNIFDYDEVHQYGANLLTDLDEYHLKNKTVARSILAGEVKTIGSEFKLRPLHKKLRPYLQSLGPLSVSEISNDLIALSLKIKKTCRLLQNRLNKFDVMSELASMPSQTQKKFRQFHQKNLLHCQQMETEINQGLADYKQKLQQKQQKLDLRIAVAKVDKAQSIFKFNLKAPKNCQLPYVYDVDHEQTEYDFSIDTSLESINFYLEKMQKNGELDILFNHTGANPVCSAKEREVRVTFSQAPQVHWDDVKKQIYLEIPEVVCSAKLAPTTKLFNFLKATDPASARIYLNPKVCEDGSICIDPELAAKATLFAKKSKFVPGLLSALKISTVLYPIVLQTILKDKVQGLQKTLATKQFSVPDINLNGEIKLPQIEIKKVFTRAEGLKVYFNIRRDPPSPSQDNP